MNEELIEEISEVYIHFHKYIDQYCQEQYQSASNCIAAAELTKLYFEKLKRKERHE